MSDPTQPPSEGLRPKYPPGFRARRGRNWFFLGLNYGSYYFNRYNLSIAAKELCDKFGFSNEQYGWINTARNWSYAVGQFWNGLLADKLGGRRAMAIGGYGTALMNLLFGLAAYSRLMGPLFGVLGWFVAIRGIDGYIQAFGAPGMVKINTAWFQRRERGGFAGIFGAMINLGRVAVLWVCPLLLGGFTIWHYRVPEGNWQWVFFVPAGAVVIITTLMLFMTRNTPEDAGYPGAVPLETIDGKDAQPLPLGFVFRTILKNKAVWLCASAYFCTGVVRYSIDDWFPKYFQEVQQVSLTSTVFRILAFAIPAVATLGSMASGYASDLLVKGRRAPVAAVLYFAETSIILLGAQVTATWAVVVTLILVAFTCNATHSILGTAAAMDAGGRKMAGFAAGVIDSFQYIGAGLAGAFLGRLLDLYGWGAWLYFMAGFGFLGGLLMVIMVLSGIERKQAAQQA